MLSADACPTVEVESAWVSAASWSEVADAAAALVNGGSVRPPVDGPDATVVVWSGDGAYGWMALRPTAGGLEVAHNGRGAFVALEGTEAWRTRWKVAARTIDIVVRADGGWDFALGACDRLS